MTTTNQSSTQQIQQHHLQQQYNGINHNQIDINGNPINPPQIPNITTLQPPLNMQYYAQPTQYTNAYTNPYNTPYQQQRQVTIPHSQNSYQTSISHPQNSYQTPTEYANKPVVIPVRLQRSTKLKNKDKEFLLSLQKRYPLTSQYHKIEFNIKLYEEVDSDDEDIVLVNENPKKLNDKTTNHQVKSKKKKMSHSDDTIKNVMKWILINNKTSRTKLRISIGVADAISADIFKMLNDIIYTNNLIYKFCDGIFCGAKVEVNGKLFSPHIKKDLQISNQRIQRLYADIVDEVNMKRIPKLEELALKESKLKELEKEKASEQNKKRKRISKNKNDNDNNNNNSDTEKEPPSKKRRQEQNTSPVSNA
eukprot:169162_1